MEYPIVTDPTDSIILCFPRELVPIVAPCFRLLAWRSSWDSVADAEHGYQLAAWLQEQMMYPCGISERLDRIIAAMGYAAGREPADPAYDAADTQRAAIERLKAQISAGGTITLDDVVAYINQLEKYVYGLVDLIGDHDLDPPVP